MVDSILIHPNYNTDAKGMPNFDIALVHTNAPFLVTPPFTPRLINLPAQQGNVAPVGEAKNF
jgi:hypothetical protein